LKAELIINLTAGGGKPRPHLKTIFKYLKENGFNFKANYTSYPGEAIELAQKAADKGIDLRSYRVNWWGWNSKRNCKRNYEIKK